MKRIASLVLALSLLAATIGIPSTGSDAAGPADSYVADWDAVAVQAVGAAGLTPPDGHVVFAWMGIAAYDSVVAIKGGYEHFAVKAPRSPSASAEAAVAAAAYRTLSRLLSEQDTSILAPAYSRSLASIASGRAKDDGVALGKKVADELFVLRASDGYQPYVYAPPSPPTPGGWLPTAATRPIGESLGRVTPFALPSADEFRPDGPPRLTSGDWAREYNEVKEIGSRTSTRRTAAQTLAARFWGEAPVPQARGSFQKFVRDQQMDVLDAARFMAAISVTYADALIACFDAKYHYAFWRPVTAIVAGASDANDQTAPDAGWLPLLPGTPNHPEYPSAHSCITPAGAAVIADYLGTQQIRFTVPSVSGLGDRYYATVADLSTEVAEARIWGGIHFRSAIEDGTEIGKRTADYVLTHHFRRVID